MTDTRAQVVLLCRIVRNMATMIHDLTNAQIQLRQEVLAARGENRRLHFRAYARPQSGIVSVPQNRFDG